MEQKRNQNYLQKRQTGQTVRTGIPMKASLTPPEEITAVAAA